MRTKIPLDASTHLDSEIHAWIWVKDGNAGAEQGAWPDLFGSVLTSLLWIRSGIDDGCNVVFSSHVWPFGAMLENFQPVQAMPNSGDLSTNPTL